MQILQVNLSFATSTVQVQAHSRIIGPAPLYNFLNQSNLSSWWLIENRKGL